jgi:hypothetical protein
MTVQSYLLDSLDCKVEEEDLIYCDLVVVTAPDSVGEDLRTIQIGVKLSLDDKQEPSGSETELSDDVQSGLTPEERAMGE